MREERYVSFSSSCRVALGFPVELISLDPQLDPHGATGNGNPVGGNVTSNVSGEDVSYEGSFFRQRLRPSTVPHSRLHQANVLYFLSIQLQSG